MNLVVGATIEHEAARGLSGGWLYSLLFGLKGTLIPRQWWYVCVAFSR